MERQGSPATGQGKEVQQLDKTVKNQTRIKEKMHLLTLGWRFEFNSGCHDVHYISWSELLFSFTSMFGMEEATKDS